METRAALGDRFGICQWFHLGDDRLLEATVGALDRLGVRHLRTGISWADWHRPGGRAWYDRQMRTLAEADLEILLSVWHTPPSLSVAPELERCSVPPARTKDYADFIDLVIDRYGDLFQHLELWNEPNNPYKWDPAFDPDGQRYAELVCNAGHWARQRGKTPILGGMTLLDYGFVERMHRFQAYQFVDIVGIHAFPHMWEPFATDWEHPDHWFGWEHRVREITRATGRPVWVTETGLATYRKDLAARAGERRQSDALLAAAEAPADRVYWYCLFDLEPARLAIEEANGGPREEAEYHLGLVRYNPRYRVSGHEKPAFRTLESLLTEDPPRAAGRRAPGGDPGCGPMPRARTPAGRASSRA